jgi:NitT/TauT family transport system permease protein
MNGTRDRAWIVTPVGTVAGVLVVATLLALVRGLAGNTGAIAAVWDWRFLLVLCVWCLTWMLNSWLAARAQTAGARLLVAIVFGVALIGLWELVVRLYAVPQVILPPPSAIRVTFVQNIPILWGDFVQTILKGGMAGFAIGCGAALVVAVVADRFDFLRRGLLPVGSFMAALPIVGTAPILVMWYGFGWQSKAAVVVAMVFFPVLVNTVAGLRDTTAMQRDLMQTYSASYWQTLVKLRLPAAMPFIFNGLKIATTLAFIGAIVAEFFGSPTVGLGFRISTSVGALALDMVWSAILVSALAGSAFYGIVALIERWVTFWHPSQRV